MKDQELRARVIAYNKAVAAQRKVCEIVTACGITIDPEPEHPPDRPGLTWVPTQAIAGGPITWVESEYDPTLPGTAETPLEFKPGATVYPNYYYTLGGVRKVWTGEITTGPEWEDERFVEF